MINDKLLENRIIFLNGEVDNITAHDIITKLLYLDSINNEEISFYINSRGGDVIQGLAIIDCMNIIKSNVATYCIGSAYSMASIILSCGTKGKRYALPNSEIMIHSPSSRLVGTSDEIELSSKRLSLTKQKLIEILYTTTNKTKKQIEQQLNYDNFMNTTQALQFGIIDKIIKSS